MNFNYICWRFWCEGFCHLLNYLFVWVAKFEFSMEIAHLGKEFPLSCEVLFFVSLIMYGLGSWNFFCILLRKEFFVKMEIILAWHLQVFHLKNFVGWNLENFLNVSRRIHIDNCRLEMCPTFDNHVVNLTYKLLHCVIWVRSPKVKNFK